MKQAYCTYFDHNYLPRALLMLQSLRAVDPDTPIFILALSDLCETALRRMGLDGVTIIPLPSLEAAFEELPRLKNERKKVEYFFTLTPFLPLHIFNTTEVRMLTCIDADLYFFSDPRPVLAAMGTVSIAITPHRFSPDHAAGIQYGRFNVGWMTFRRDLEGMTCLGRYRDECVAWCYDRVEDGRFADQGYLNSWPDRYKSLLIIEHKGMDLAPWNVDNYTLEERDGQILVDDDPLIFYHFHGIRCRRDGSFNFMLPRSAAQGSVQLRRLYHPYMTQLVKCRAELHRDFPAIQKAEEVLRHGDLESDAEKCVLQRGISWPQTGLDVAQLKTVVELYFALAEVRHELSLAGERTKIFETAAAERLPALQQQEAVIAQRDTALAEVRGELCNAYEHIGAQGTAAADRLAAIHQKDATIAGLDAALTEVRGELSNACERMKALDATAAEQLAAIHAKDTVIARLNASLSECRDRPGRLFFRWIKGLFTGPKGKPTPRGSLKD